MRSHYKRAAGTLVAFFLSFVLAACGGSLTETSGNTLPPDMAMPSPTGNVQTFADAVCEWAASSQIDFDARELGEVWVTRAVGASGGRYESGSLLRTFLQRDEPDAIALYLDPQYLGAASEPNELLYSRIRRSAVWRIVRVECPGVADVAVRVERADGPSCVLVEEAQATDIAATTAEYYDLHFVLSGPIGQQPFNVQVLSIFRDEVLIGRSVSVRFHTTGGRPGLRRECQPGLIVSAFESTTSENH